MIVVITLIDHNVPSSMSVVCLSASPAGSKERDVQGTTQANHTHTHSDIGFQFVQFPGKKAMEPKGEKVGALEDVSKNGLCTSAVHERAAAEGGGRKKVFGGVSWNNHEPNRGE